MKLKQTGKEVKMGEKFIKVLEVSGTLVPVSVVEVNETTLPDLINKGLIEVIRVDSDSDTITIEKAVQNIAARIGWDKVDLEKYFNNLYKISPAAVFEIVLKEVAIMLDKKYPNHINNSKEIWVINKINGKIQKLKDSSRIKSFKHFAAFRCLDDAIIAKNVMAPALKDLYGKQKN